MKSENLTECDSCEGKGFLHMDDPYEIERCDTCKKFDTDDKAQEVHRETCKCGWPTVDWPSAFQSWASSIRASWESEADRDIETLENLVDCRGQKFIDNLNNIEEHLMYMSQAPYSFTKAEEGSQAPTLIGSKVISLLELSVKVREMAERNEVSAKDFGDPPYAETKEEPEEE